MFINRKHAAHYHGLLRKGTKLGPYNTNKNGDRDVDYSLGNKYCKNYNDEDIKCVVCYEQNLKKKRGCFV